MRLTYWTATIIGDNPAYSIRARTKGEAVAERAYRSADFGEVYGPVMKVVVEYASGFDLLEQCLSEGGHDHEPREW